MVTYKDRKKWILLGFGFFLIGILLITLLFLIFSESKIPDNGIIVNDETIRGEEENQQAVEKLNALFEKEPVLKELPITVEYYSENYSKYTKYILSYEMDNSERGFVVIMKDYTGAGTDVAFDKLREMGMDLTDLKMVYEDLVDSSLNFRADVI